MTVPARAPRNIFQSTPLLFQIVAFLSVSLVGVALSPPTLAQEIVDQWRMNLRRPAEGWKQPGFDDGDWQESNGGFGTLDTPGARIGTVWATNSIWLRKHIPLATIPAKPALLIHHDEDAEVYLNGTPVASLKGFTTDYQLIPIEPKDVSALKVGDNVLAVHCRQTGGGQFIDVHLVDANNVPKLPVPERSTKPFLSELITTWGAEVTADNAWQEYPRPQFRRDAWTVLNGHWDYAITPIEQAEVPSEWTGKILVPFCLESKLGGVQRLLDGSEALWYHRTFELTPTPGDRQLLNFEAVDYRCEVFVNGMSVGTHRGGHTPFTIDITDAAREGSNTVVVRVEDETEGWQLRGKQTLNARGIWYTQVSGIWQTVWLEQVPAAYLQDIKTDTDAGTGAMTVRPVVVGGDGLTVNLTVRDGQTEVAQATSSLDGGGSGTMDVVVPNPKLWSPSSPFLYDLELTLARCGRPSCRSCAILRGDSNGREGTGCPGELAVYPQRRTNFSLGAAGPRLVARRFADTTFGRGDAVRHQVAQGRGLQHDSKTHQGRTETLLLSLRPAWHDGLAGSCQWRSAA